MGVRGDVQAKHALGLGRHLPLAHAPSRDGSQAVLVAASGVGRDALRDSPLAFDAVQPLGAIQ